jgi:hypothetical protein
MKRWKKNLLVLALLSFAVIFANVTPKYHTVSAASKTTLNYKKKTLTKGQTLKLKVKGTKKKVKWSSSKKKVASVNEKGKVTAKRKGKAVITAKVGAKKYRCKITVVLPKKETEAAGQKTPETTVTPAKSETQITETPATETPATETPATEVPEEPKAVLVKEAQTKVVDLGYAQYLVVAFEEGYDVENCSVAVDGVDITRALTKVTDDGSIVKWELTGLNPAKLVVTQKDDQKTQDIVLSDNKNPGKPVVKSQKPMYFLTHAAIPTWDYHLGNYDEEGNARVDLKKTTFDLKETAKENVKYHAPDAELSKDTDADNLYGVSGNAEILFNYTTQEEKDWFDAIADEGALALLSGDERMSTLNDQLTYTKDTTEHGGNVVGRITIPLGQSNFYSNGRYKVRIRSNGNKTLIASIHVVNAQAPSMKISETGVIRSGMNVHFQVENMVYGITVPIEMVTLKTPSGEVKTLEKITDWYLIGDTFVLYNDVNAESGRNNIEQPGVYTLTVYANGFKSMSKSFAVAGEATKAEKTAKTYDVVTRATSSGNTGSGSEGESGSSVMPANLVFSEDLLSNAKILVALGVKNASAEAVAGRWDDQITACDAVYGEDGVVFYDYTSYYDAVQEAKLNGQYLSFADYIADENAVTTENRPYAVKVVLEDGLFGETQYNGTYKGKEAPVLILDADAEFAAEGKDLVLISQDARAAEYFEKITGIYVNQNWKELTKDQYSTEDGKLVIKASALTLGTNTVEIKAEGFKNNTLSVEYKKVLEENLSLGSDKEQYNRGENVILTVNGSEGDFLKNLNAVKVDGRNIYAKGVAGSDYYYEAAEDLKSITIYDNGNLFGQNKAYTLTLEAEYYETLETEITVQGEEKDVPATEAAIRKGEDGQTYLVSFGTPKDFVSWKNKVTLITVNGTTYTEAGWFGMSENQFKWETDGYGNQVLKLKVDSEFDENADGNTFTIKAEGYKDLTLPLVVNVIEKLEAPKSVSCEYSFFSGNYTISYGISSDIEQWMEKITSLTVNGTEYTKVSSSFSMSENTYYLIKNDGQLCFGSGAAAEGENTVVISAEGYQDCTVTFTK